MRRTRRALRHDIVGNVCWPKQLNSSAQALATECGFDRDSLWQQFPREPDPYSHLGRALKARGAGAREVERGWRDVRTASPHTLDAHSGGGGGRRACGRSAGVRSGIPAAHRSMRVAQERGCGHARRPRAYSFRTLTARAPACAARSARGCVLRLMGARRARRAGFVLVGAWCAWALRRQPVGSPRTFPRGSGQCGRPSAQCPACSSEVAPVDLLDGPRSL